MTVTSPAPLQSDQPAQPSVSTALRAAIDLQQFAGAVRPETLRLMLLGSSVDEHWFTGPAWSLLLRLYRQRANQAEVELAVADHLAAPLRHATR